MNGLRKRSHEAMIVSFKTVVNVDGNFDIGATIVNVRHQSLVNIPVLSVEWSFMNVVKHVPKKRLIVVPGRV